MSEQGNIEHTPNPFPFEDKFDEDFVDEYCRRHITNSSYRSSEDVTLDQAEEVAELGDN